MDAKFYQCRDLGHAWQWDTDGNVEKVSRRAWRFTRHLSCLRCGTVRTDTYVVNPGHVERAGAGYKYPTGYRTPGGFTVEAARVALFAKVIRGVR